MLYNTFAYLAGMSEIIVPTDVQLLLPTVRALKALGGSGTPAEILAKIIESEKLDEAVMDVLMGDNRTSKLASNASWARSLLKYYNAVENSKRGVWSLTDLGESLTERDIPDIIRNWREVNREYRKSKSKQGAVTAILEHAPISEPESQVNLAAAVTDEADWRPELLNLLYAISPAAFERLCQRLLRESGFIDVEVMGRTGDGGLDGVGILRINLVSFRVHFQCKRYQGGISNAAIRDFRGATVGRSDRGLFITTGHFTRAAKEEASRDGAALIDLIDGETLCDLLYDLKLGVSVQTVERVVVDRRWYESI